MRGFLWIKKNMNLCSKNIKTEKLFFSLGRLVPYKGFSYLVDAARLLPEEYIIIIGGNGPLSQELKSQISSSGLEEKSDSCGKNR